MDGRLVTTDRNPNNAERFKENNYTVRKCDNNKHNNGKHLLIKSISHTLHRSIKKYKGM